MKLNHVDDVIDEFLKYIKNNPLKHRRLRDHLKSSDASHQEIIYHHHIRWLSKAKSYKRIYDLHEHILEFIETEGLKEDIKYYKSSKNKKWFMDFIFIIDILEKMNNLNLRLQGKNKHACNMFSDIKGFLLNLKNIKEKISKMTCLHYPY